MNQQPIRLYSSVKTFKKAHLLVRRLLLDRKNGGRILLRRQRNVHVDIHKRRLGRLGRLALVLAFALGRRLAALAAPIRVAVLVLFVVLVLVSFTLILDVVVIEQVTRIVVLVAGQRIGHGEHNLVLLQAQLLDPRRDRVALTPLLANQRAERVPVHAGRQRLAHSQHGLVAHGVMVFQQTRLVLSGRLLLLELRNALQVIVANAIDLAPRGRLLRNQARCTGASRKCL